MYDKTNILSIIEGHQKEITEIESAIKDANNEVVVQALSSRLSFLTDNKCRYEMQARAWGLMQ